jgi:hypothetical protein
MTKNEILKETASFILNQENRLNKQDIYLHFAQKLNPQKLAVGIGMAYAPPRLSEKDFLLVNEVIWDLIVERAITPGFDQTNDDLPWLSITNKTILENYSK